MNIQAKRQDKDVIGALDSGPSSSFVIAPSGARIDVTGKIWKIGAAESLNWRLMPLESGNALLATQLYFRIFVTRRNPRYIAGQFSWLKAVFVAAKRLGFDINDVTQYDIKLFEAVRNYLRDHVNGGTVSNYLDAYRRWYLWCTEMDVAGFDEEVATVLESRIIGGNTKGAAVLSDDRQQGPLSPPEFHMVTNYLRRATEECLLPIGHLAAIWLFVAFGTNPKNLLLLNEEDLIKTRLPDGSVVYELRVPRIKKRTRGLRDELTTRSILPQIGKLLEELIAENSQRELGQTGKNRDFERPLFRSYSPKSDLLNTDFESDAYRRRTQFFNNVLQQFVQISDLRSADGHQLTLTPRRLRYSFATRLVQEGASPYELAIALDHTDCQHVMVYFNARSEAVVALDDALSLTMTKGP